MVKKQNFTLAVIILMIAIFLIGYGRNLKFSDKSCEGQDLKITEIKKIQPLGNDNAPLLVEVYSDYQCPFCARYFVETITPIINEYVDTGRARLIYHDLAFEGDRSQWAAEAVYCANDQGKFWEYHQAIFNERYNSGKTNVYKKESLKKIAKEIGLDECEFNICLDSGKYAQIIKNATKTAFDEKRINGTPTTFLNGKMVTNEQGQNLGAMPYSMLKDKIEIALKNL